MPTTLDLPPKATARQMRATRFAQRIPPQLPPMSQEIVKSAERQARR